MPYVWQKVGAEMKHKKEWHTCDRCGTEIKQMPHFTDWFYRKVCSPTEFEMEYSETKGFIADSKLVSENVMSVKICEFQNVKKKIFDLCPKCREEFERWMKDDC